MSTLRPLFTNAYINRRSALECLEAGMTIHDIVTVWPEVFHIAQENGQNKLGQTYHDEGMYDYVDEDGERVRETSHTISFVTEVIAAFKAGLSAETIAAQYDAL